MKHPTQPDTQKDEYLADLPAAHRAPATPPATDDGAITPTDPSSMPRGEDDERTGRDSPEFNDRPDAPPRPDR
jgi:hypothetical protein